MYFLLNITLKNISPKPQTRISHHLTLDLNIKIGDIIRSGIKMILKFEFPINTVTLSLPRSH